MHLLVLENIQTKDSIYSWTRSRAQTLRDKPANSSSPSIQAARKRMFDLRSGCWNNSAAQLKFRCCFWVVAIGVVGLAARRVYNVSGV